MSKRRLPRRGRCCWCTGSTAKRRGSWWSPTTAALSALFQRQQIEKRYRAEVKGNVADRLGAWSEFTAPRDGKPAQTAFTVAACDPEHDAATVDVRIATGRMHQIRRHFTDAGFPVLGDPRYGRGNSDPRGACACSPVILPSAARSAASRRRSRSTLPSSAIRPDYRLSLHRLWCDIVSLRCR